MPFDILRFVMGKVVASNQGVDDQRATQLGLIGAMIPGNSMMGMLIPLVIAQNEAGSTATSPAATAQAAGDLTDSAATLHGTVNPHDASTTVTFEISATAGGPYTSVPAVPSPVGGSSSINVSAAVPDLSPSTSYFFRVVAQSSAGAAQSGEGSFITNGVISGRVTNANGAGVAGIQVTAVPEGATAGSSQITDSSGNYSFPNISPATYTISVQPPAGMQTPTPQPVTLATGPVPPVNFQLLSMTGMISGQITDAIGAGLVGVEVIAVPEGAMTGSSRITDSSGNYSFTDMNLGIYTISVQPPAGMQTPEAQTVTLATGTIPPVDFQLMASTGTISGQVTDRQGAGVADIPVTAIPDGATSGITKTTDASGNYSITDINADTYTVSVQPPDGMPIPPVQTVQLAAGGTATANFELVAGPVLLAVEAQRRPSKGATRA